MKRKLIKNVSLLNTLSSLLLQVVTLVSGFIIPRIILLYFGSEVNGLVSSITKILSYVNLLEGGITGVIMASLYKPLVNNDYDKVSAILCTSKSFYKKISIAFVAFSLLISIVYPLIVPSNYSFEYIFALILILSISSFIQYCYTLTVRTLLCADKKVYIVSLTQASIVVIGIVLSCVTLAIGPSIHLFKLAPSIIFITQPIIYNKIVKNRYNINWNLPQDKKLIKARWDGFALNIADFVHTNTDIIILTFLSGFSSVSIYSVYALVASALRTSFQSISYGIRPSIGRIYAKGDKAALIGKINIYECIVFFLAFLSFSVVLYLIVPFVMMYTSEVNDANYYHPIFATLIITAEAISVLRSAHLDLAYSANKFKDIKIPCFFEAIINIVISVALVAPLGLIGVAIGTLSASIYRTVFHVWYTKKLVGKPQKDFYLKLLSFGAFMAVGILLCTFIPKADYNLLSILEHGILYVLIFGVLYFCNFSLFYRRELKGFLKYVKRK